MDKFYGRFSEGSQISCGQKVVKTIKIFGSTSVRNPLISGQSLDQCQLRWAHMKGDNLRKLPSTKYWPVIPRKGPILSQKVNHPEPNLGDFFLKNWILQKFDKSGWMVPLACPPEVPSDQEHVIHVVEQVWQALGAILDDYFHTWQSDPSTLTKLRNYFEIWWFRRK